MPPMEDTWYRAIVSRDARFDGVFFVGVTTTGIYCRPLCPARTPGRDRVRFFRVAAEAERDGFRACFRCRPELAPGNASVDAPSRLAAAAAGRIEAGLEESLEELSRALGVTSRHLRRTLRKELGVSPVELVQSKRIGLAKQLPHDTMLPIAEVAFASGFGSVRRFNALFRRRFGRPPGEVRKTHGAGASAGVILRLDYRPPFDWQALLEFLAARAIPGVESVAGDSYRRTIRIEGRQGFVVVRPDPSRTALRAEVSLSLTGALLPVKARLRALFDLDAHPLAIAAQLQRDRRLRPLLRRHPGLRVPGAFDGFEVAVRAILGQQVSVKGASTLAGRLAEALGTPVETPHADLRFTFPEARTVARNAFSIGVPTARAEAIRTLARAVERGDVVLAPHADAERTIVRLLELPGIGPWTAQYIAIRALHWPDAYPEGDLILRREAPEHETWRPWRAYGAMHVWRHHAGNVERAPERLRAVGAR